MELNWIEATIDALKSLGISAQRGFPNGLLPSLTEHMAAVSIQKSEGQSMTVLVQIYTPVDQGATACENLGLRAAAALREIGAVCTIGACSFSSKSSMFTIGLQTQYSEQDSPTPVTGVTQPSVQIDGQTVGNILDVATSFSSTSVKSKDATTGEIIMVAGEQRWRVTLEDLISASTSPIESVDEAFELTVTRGTQKETYEGCCWEKTSSDVTASGIKRSRTAVTCNAPTVSTVS